ncbi:hypothetical protein VU03_02465 [Desulfobulbus sp. N3]|nr:hypothetical protein [Desulfobulbus sp. N3]
MAADLLRSQRTDWQAVEPHCSTSSPCVLVDQAVLGDLLKRDLAEEKHLCSDEVAGHGDCDEEQQDAGCGHVSEDALILERSHREALQR